jgi:hypothetical protein
MGYKLVFKGLIFEIGENKNFVVQVQEETFCAFILFVR